MIVTGASDYYLNLVNFSQYYVYIHIYIHHNILPIIGASSWLLSLHLRLTDTIPTV